MSTRSLEPIESSFQAGKTGTGGEPLTGADLLVPNATEFDGESGDASPPLPTASPPTNGLKTSVGGPSPSSPQYPTQKMICYVGGIFE